MTGCAGRCSRGRGVEKAFGIGPGEVIIYACGGISDIRCRTNMSRSCWRNVVLRWLLVAFGVGCRRMHPSFKADALAQYVIGFVPDSNASPKRHNIEVRVAKKSSGSIEGGKRRAVY
jgi:hypothetical protein